MLYIFIILYNVIEIINILNVLIIHK